MLTDSLKNTTKNAFFALQMAKFISKMLFLGKKEFFAVMTYLN